MRKCKYLVMVILKYNYESPTSHNDLSRSLLAADDLEVRVDGGNAYQRLGRVECSWHTQNQVLEKIT